MEKLKLSDNTAKLHQMFGKKLYTDRYSFISEICQNAVDSHRMAGQKDPVIVGITDGKPVFYVKDTGLSFDSKEDFVKKICTILESGKSEEKDNSEMCAMGMHGIGSISVSAFQPEWKYTVVKNGRKFTATLKEVEGVGLTYEISDYIDTEEDKYVLFEVSIPDDNMFMHDFVDNMKIKLCYFKDILFEFGEEIIASNKSLLTLNTEFKIFQTDDMQVSTLSKNYYMHVCLDQYYYPINWEKLGIAPININVGLRFSLADGLVPNITREELVYTDDYVDLIKQKIEKVASWFIKRYNDSMPDDLTSIKKYMAEMSPTKMVTIEKINFVINDLSIYSKSNIKELNFKDVSKYVLNRYIIHTMKGEALYKYTGEIATSGTKVTRSYYAFRQKRMILVDKPMSVRLSSYVRNYERGSGLYVRLKTSLKRGDYSYRSILGLNYNNRHLWREYIKEMQILERSFEEDTFIKSSEIIIPDSFTTSPRKKAIRKDKVDLDRMIGEVGVKYGKRMDKSHAEWNCKFEEKTLKIRDLHKQPFLHVYGNEKERFRLDVLYTLVSKRVNHISPCIISDRQQSYIKQLNLHNFMGVEDFFKGKHKLLKSIITAYLINRFISKYDSIFRHQETIEKYISSKFAGDMKELRAFSSKYITRTSFVDDTFMKELLKYAKEHKLYDLSIWEKYQQVKADINNFNFVEFFVGYGNSLKSEIAMKALQDIAKYRMIKMDWKYYGMDFKTDK